MVNLPRHFQSTFKYITLNSINFIFLLWTFLICLYYIAFLRNGLQLPYAIVKSRINQSNGTDQSQFPVTKAGQYKCDSYLMLFQFVLYKHDRMYWLTLQHSTVETSYCIYTHTKEVKQRCQINGNHWNHSLALDVYVMPCENLPERVITINKSMWVCTHTVVYSEGMSYTSVDICS